MQAKRLHVLHAHETKELAKGPVRSMTIDTVTTQQRSLAMESAPLTLMKGQLSVIFHTRAVSSDCSNIRQNLFFAFVYNAPACRWQRTCCIRCSVW